MNQLSIACVFILNIWFVLADRFEIELFSEHGCKGQSIRFDRGQKDLDCVRNLLGGNFLSARIAGGWWSANTAESDFRVFIAESVFDCTDFYGHPDVAHIEEVQPLGIISTETSAIALASWLKSYDAFVTEKGAEAFVNVIWNVAQTYVVTTGYTNFTIFENNKFEGDFECLYASCATNLYSVTLPTIGSFLRGCSDKYLSEVIQRVESISSVPNTLTFAHPQYSQSC